MSNDMNRSKVVFIEKRLLKSKAYRSLKTPTAYFVLGIFWTKRQMIRVRHSGRKEYDIANNGEIVFTYKEAGGAYGITGGTFRNAIDELRDKGFIDIAESGAGVQETKNLYAISERWKLYGTSEYEPPRPRPKGPINRGFKKGNRLGRNCKTKSTVKV